MVVLLFPVAWANATADCANTNASANPITINLFLLILLMIQCLLLLPFGRVAKTSFLRGRYPDSRPKYSTTFSAFPSKWDSGFFVADFVAVYSCEGSGGIAPLFPLTSSASWLSKKRSAKNAEHSLPSLTVRQTSNFPRRPQQ